MLWDKALSYSASDEMEGIIYTLQERNLSAATYREIAELYCEHVQWEAGQIKKAPPTVNIAFVGHTICFTFAYVYSIHTTA